MPSAGGAPAVRGDHRSGNTAVPWDSLELPSPLNLNARMGGCLPQEVHQIGEGLQGRRLSLGRPYPAPRPGQRLWYTQHF